MEGKDAIEHVYKRGTQSSSDQHNFFTISYSSSWNTSSHQLCSAGIMLNVFMIHIHLRGWRYFYWNTAFNIFPKNGSREKSLTKDPFIWLPWLYFSYCLASLPLLLLCVIPGVLIVSFLVEPVSHLISVQHITKGQQLQRASWIKLLKTHKSSWRIVKWICSFCCCSASGKRSAKE